MQIYGGGGYLKGMEVERAYRDAKITTSTRALTRSSGWSSPLICWAGWARAPAAREPFGGQENPRPSPAFAKRPSSGRGCCPAGGRPCGGAEEGWSRLLRGHPYGYAHPAGGAGGLRGQRASGRKRT
ncbi:MAG: hypothetical protein ACLSHJ_10770 [Oscillospiraceae bacterium]